jgi:hypothetical protein
MEVVSDAWRHGVISKNLFQFVVNKTDTETSSESGNLNGGILVTGIEAGEIYPILAIVVPKYFNISFRNNMSGKNLKRCPFGLFIQ